MAQLKKKQVLEALEATNGLIQLAAKRLKCSPQTIYNWKKKSPEVAALIENSREELGDLGEYNLRDLLLKKDRWATGFVLTTLCKNRGYAARSDQGSKNSEPLFQKVYAGFDPDKV